MAGSIWEALERAERELAALRLVVASAHAGEAQAEKIREAALIVTANVRHGAECSFVRYETGRCNCGLHLLRAVLDALEEK
jgi:hypothetical protein